MAMVAGGIGLAIATGGIATPAVAGGLALTTASTVAKTIGDFNKASLLPNIQGSQPTGDILFASNRNRFVFRKMRAKTEYLRIIDDYFTRFRLCNQKIRNAEFNWKSVLELR